MMQRITPTKHVAKMTTSQWYTHTWETVQADSPAFQGPWTLLEGSGTRSHRAGVPKRHRKPEMGRNADQVPIRGCYVNCRK